MKKSLLTGILVVFVLFLSVINIHNFLAPKKILGLKTQNQNIKKEFWENFLKENPNYIPGWIEIGRMDKVTEIDPNYFTLP